MEEFVITIITVIKLIYRWNSMEEKKGKQTNKIHLMKNLVRQTLIEIILSLMSQTLNRNIKNCYRKKKAKNNGKYSTFHGPLSQE